MSVASESKSSDRRIRRSWRSRYKAASADTRDVTIDAQIQGNVRRRANECWIWYCWLYKSRKSIYTSKYYVYNGSITLMFAVYVAVIYFVFLICICVLAVLVTIVVQYLHLRTESKPFRAMPSWVSGDICVPYIKFIQATRNYILPHLFSVRLSSHTGVPRLIKGIFNLTAVTIFKLVASTLNHIDWFTDWVSNQLHLHVRFHSSENM